MKFECEKDPAGQCHRRRFPRDHQTRSHPCAGRHLPEGRGLYLTLTGYDMEMGITTTIECNVLVPGETVLDAKLLGSMVSRMPAGDICIELTDEGEPESAAAWLSLRFPR